MTTQIFPVNPTGLEEVVESLLKGKPTPEDDPI